MARKRAYKKRVDYRKGGRVQYQEGSQVFDPNTGEPLGPGSFVPPSSSAAVGGGTTLSPADQAKADARAKFDLIPATGNYTEQQTQDVQDAIKIGAITTDEAATKFGVRPDQITQEIGRREAVKAGKDLSPPDFIDMMYRMPGDYRGLYEDPYGKKHGGDDPLPNMEAQQQAVADITADGSYTADETQKVVTALNSGAMTTEQVAAQFGVDPSQVEAELGRQNQTADVPDPFAGQSLPNVANQQAIKDTIKDVSFTDAAAKDAYVPGSYLKSYNPVNVSTVTPKQTATAIDRTGTMTPDSAVQNLDAFTGITGIDPATSEAIKKASGKVKEGVVDGTIQASDYEAVLAGELAKTIPAFAGAPTKAVMDEIKALTSPAQAAQISETEAASRRASGVDYVIDSKAFVPEVTGTAVTLSDTPEAEAATRAAITGTKATGQEAQIIDQVGYTARQRVAVTGEAAKGAAANAIAATAEIPPDIAANVVEDPASVAAVVDTQPIEVQAAIAALPPEALVSAQMETLLGGMESGNIPAWAKPAVSTVEQGLAARGLGVSTVGRDALFNAIIQTALPIAQSNAQALQSNAAQNLSNQQQANLEEARLDATRRLSNLSNQQTAASQTAQFAQNLKVLQSQQNQEAALLSAQQQQQTRTQNLQNRQRAAEQSSQNQQQINSQELGNAQQIELANLEIKNQTEQQNMTAENQERLVEMQVAADFLSKNAAFKQQMEVANLNADQQMRLANLTALNQADAQSLDNIQRTELANLNATMQSNIMQGRIAAQMGVAQLNVDQQRAITNAATQARIDLTKFTTEQQVELANSQFMQNTTITNMNARQQAAMQQATAMASLDLSTADSRTRLAIENARNFLQIDVANLNNAQQATILDTQMEQQRLLSDQSAANVARQFSATADNQVDMFLATQKNAMEQFNASQTNAMEQFNTSEANRLSALDENNALDVARFNAQIELQVQQFNNNVENQRDIWNASNTQAIEQANTNWRRQSNTANTAAINAANAQNVQNAFAISTQELDFIWNSLRDEATFLRKQALDTASQKTNMYITAMNNEANTAINSSGVAEGVKTLINEMFE